MSVKVKNVLLLDNVDPSAKTILESRGINATLQKDKLSQESLITELQKYDGVVVRSATKVTSEIIEKCPNLKIIGRAGTGVDNVDIPCATKHGIVVMNTPGGNTLSAAEHTCTLITCLSRNVPAADASMKAGKWDRKAFMGHELFGKTLAIVGLGRIGREAAIRMQSFGMKTIGFDPLVSKEEAAKYNIEWLTVEEIWRRADYITVHTPLIKQTKGMLNDESFAKCKKGVRVINCARGGIIDEEALLRALESGQCGGAGLDVFVEEPPTKLDLIKHPKVVACPHLGASTKEAQSRCGREIAEQIADVSEEKGYFGVLNAPALCQGASPGVSEWITALTSTGHLVRSFMKQSPGSITIESFGDLLSGAGQCLKAAFSAGYMKTASACVNLVNAPALLATSGTEVNVKASKVTSDLACIVSAQNETTKINLVIGVIRNTPVMVAIDGMKLSVPVILQGSLVVLQSASKNLSRIIETLTGQGASTTSLSTTEPKNDLQWFALGTDKPIDVNIFSNYNATFTQF